MWLVLADVAYAEDAVLTAASCGSTSPEAMLFDVAVETTTDGTLWAAAVHADIVNEPDHLGNTRRWDNGICLSRRGPDGWSAPIVLDDAEIRIAPGGLRLAAAPDGDLWVIYSGDHVSPKDDGPVPPGLYDVRLVKIGPDGVSAPESLVDLHPRLLHGFDLAFAPDGSAHFVWAPWPGNDARERLFHQRYAHGAWSAPEPLPVHDDRNAMNPVLGFDGNDPVVSALAQTPDYANIEVVAWRGKAGGDAGPTKWTDHRLGPALDFSLEGAARVVWRVEGGLVVAAATTGRSDGRPLPMPEKVGPFAVDLPWVVGAAGPTVWAVAEGRDPVRIGGGEVVGYVAVDARSNVAVYGTGIRDRADTLMVTALPD